MSEELKPCPFCGDTPQILVNSKDKVAIKCCNFMCRINPDTRYLETEYMAKEAWNIRVVDKND